MVRILNVRGIFYLTVPIRPWRVEFNVGRLLAIDTIVEWYQQLFDPITFSYLDDQGHFYGDITLNLDTIEANCNFWNGCGIFDLRKIKKLCNLEA